MNILIVKMKFGKVLNMDSGELLSIRGRDGFRGPVFIAFEYGDDILHDIPWVIVPIEVPICNGNGKWLDTEDQKKMKTSEFDRLVERAIYLIQYADPNLNRLQAFEVLIEMVKKGEDDAKKLMNS